MAVTKTAAALLVMGLIIGVVSGYGVSFIAYPPQVSQLQSDLIETQSTLLSHTLRVSITRSVNRYKYRR